MDQQIIGKTCRKRQTYHMQVELIDTAELGDLHPELRLLHLLFIVQPNTISIM